LDLNTQAGAKPTLLKQNKLSILLYAQPTMDEAIRVNLSTNDVILFANRAANPQFGWQIIALLNAKLEDIKIGFVYAKPSQNGLILSVQENDIRLNQTIIERYYANDKSVKYWKWGALLLILLIFLHLLYRRPNVA
jgi:hypothetical protein